MKEKLIDALEKKLGEKNYNSGYVFGNGNYKEQLYLKLYGMLTEKGDTTYPNLTVIENEYARILVAPSNYENFLNIGKKYTM